MMTIWTNLQSTYKARMTALIIFVIDSLSESALIEWEYEAFVKEKHPLIITLLIKLGVNVDDLFTLAEVKK